MRSEIWTRHWLAGLSLAAAFAVVVYGVFAAGLKGMERLPDEFGPHLADRRPSERIAVIAIDEQAGSPRRCRCGQAGICS
jgi:CHASE2 domain-containing sensor protein